MQENSIQVEYAVISCMVKDEIACLDCLAQLNEKDFSHEMTILAFKTLQKMSESGTAVDETILKAKVKSDKFSKAFDSFMENVDLKTINYRQYIEELRTYSKQRHAKDILRTAYDTLLDDGIDVEEIIKKTQEELIELIIAKKQHSFAYAEDVLKEIDQNIQDPDSMEKPAITFGFKSLDEMVNIDSQAYVLIGGRPGMSKTGLMLHFVKVAAMDHGKDCLIFSLEMPKKQLTQRLVSMVSGIPLWKIIKAKGFTNQDLANFEKAKEKIKATKRKILINDDFLDISTLAALARQEKLRNPDLAAIFIDYIQLMQRSEDFNIETTKISRILKQLTKDLKIPVIALSQLSRKVDDREDHHPVISDLRDSGSLEQDADIIIFPYRPYKYSNKEEDLKICEMIIGKQRNGETGIKTIGFDPNIQRFLEIPV